MNKYKIIVYAISKNEENFVDRWVESMKEADQIYVLDTGSIDNTVSKLKERGVIVKEEIINPWRFDVARNKSLELLPEDTDICVCTDLDEVFEKGWRKKLEESWTKNATRLRYNYNWSFDECKKPAVNFLLDKIHARKNYKWTHPVHEVLKCDIEEKFITNENITLNHFPDPNKSRSSYLKLLELSVKENPEDDRNMHYLGREYMYYKKWNKCIDTLIKHLNLKTATWKDERCASMRFIARSYINLNRIEEAKKWLLKAIKEAPHLREPYVELGFIYYNEKDFINTKKTLKKALSITKKYKTYINEPYSYNGTIEDILSICEYNLGNYKNALKYGKKAALLNHDDRIKNNIKLIKETIKNTMN